MTATKITLFWLCFSFATARATIDQRFQMIKSKPDHLEFINPAKSEGWAIGTCEEENFFDSADISKIYGGYWYLAHRTAFPFLNQLYVDPFANMIDNSCRFFEISHDHVKQELIIDYKCQDERPRENKLDQCRIYVKFQSNLRIKYESSYGCDWREGLWSVYVTKTDYESFLVIRGCIETKLQDVNLFSIGQMVLIKHNLSEDKVAEIQSALKLNSTFFKNQIYDLRTKVSKPSPECNCRNSCKSSPRHCLPIEFPTHSKGFMRYLAIIWVLVGVAILVFIVYSFKKTF
jgi:hypothetical protein